MTLDELYAQQEWEEFSERFLEVYKLAPTNVQLDMLRQLLTKWRRNEVLELIVEHL